MKLAAMIVAMTFLGGINMGANASAGRRVTVYCGDKADIPEIVEVKAQSLASDMFGRIGVKLDWRPGNPSRPETGAIVIELATNIPSTLLRGALAYAMPYEGVHIRIFWDRINGTPAPRELLAHVMVHEITHILQGLSGHSDEGIMKARWTADDEYGMKQRPLGFTQEDVELIYEGMDHRGVHPPMPGAPNRVEVSAAIGISATIP